MGHLITNGDDVKQAGFAYLALLIVISASLLALSAALPDLHQTAQREREAQLLFVGNQYATAIARFYNNPTVTIKRYPETIDEILVDNRSLKPIYHLRKPYRDPITDSDEWGLVRNAEKQIMGVYSLSNSKPLKTAFVGQTPVVVVGGDEYSDIKFVYLTD